MAYYTAVQVKYRKRKANEFTRVGWGDLSTFYALTTRTGPIGTGWLQCLVFTSADGVTREGTKAQTDAELTYSALAGTSHSAWLAMSGDAGHKLAEVVSSNKLTYDQLREQRLKRLTSGRANMSSASARAADELDITRDGSSSGGSSSSSGSA